MHNLHVWIAAVDCGDLDLSGKGVEILWQSSETTYGAQAVLSCPDNGFEFFAMFISILNVTCQEDGGWDFLPVATFLLVLVLEF